MNSEQRHNLIQNLNSLPGAQLDELLFVLQPPRGNIPPNHAAPSTRIVALLEWAESSIGCGLEAIEQILETIIDENRSQSQQPSLIQGATISRDRAGAIPKIPEHFIPRAVELDHVRPILLGDSTSVGIVGIQGMGGIGKTVLATALANDPQIQDYFSDGIYWLTVGIEPRLTTLQSELALALSGNYHSFVDSQQGKQTLKKYCSGKRCLLILDDLWDSSHAEALDVLDESGKSLITTRQRELIDSLAAREYTLGLLDDEQALTLLADWSGYETAALGDDARAVMHECGNLPLTLSVCGAMVRDGILWSDVREALEDAELDYLDESLPNYPYPDVFKALGVSLKHLVSQDAHLAERYQELAVFAADETIPEIAIVTPWEHTGGLKPRDTRKVLLKLAKKGLLQQETTTSDRRVTLHDLQLDFLQTIQTQNNNLANLHRQMVEAYAAQCPNGWHTGPNDGYFFERLAYHLHKAELEKDLKDLLTDFNWLQTKIRTAGIDTLIADYNWVVDDSTFKNIQDALKLSRHVVLLDKTQLAGHLLGRLGKFDDPHVHKLLQQAAENRENYWLQPLKPNLTAPGGALIQTLYGHTDAVNAVAITPDGKKVVSASRDKTIKIWDFDTGHELKTLYGHQDWVEDLAISPDGSAIVSASKDKTIKVWDLNSGHEIRTLAGHTEAVTTVAFSSDGSRVISASHESNLVVDEWGLLDPISSSNENKLKVWDFKAGKELLELAGHNKPVRFIKAFPQDSKIISASSDKTLRIWDLNSGQCTQILSGHTDNVTGVDITLDGNQIISSSDDYTLKVWDVETGDEVHSLQHTFCLSAVALTSDGGKLISGSNDYDLQVWDFNTKEKLGTLKGHNDLIFSLAASPDGKSVVSASFDGIIKIWSISGKAIYSNPSKEDCQTEKVHKDVKDIAITKDGKKAITASNDHTLSVWGLVTRQKLSLLQGHEDRVTSVAIFSDSRRALSASSDYTLRTWDLSQGKEIRKIDCEFGEKEKKYIWSSLSIAPNDREVFSIFGDTRGSRVDSWDINKGEIRTSARLWDAVRVFLGITRCVDAIVLPLDWKVFQIIKPRTGETIDVSGHEDRVNSVILTPDDQQIISASDDRTLKIWDLATATELETLYGHTRGVTDVAVSLNGQRIASIADTELKIWDLAARNCLATFEADQSFTCCAITPDGSTVLAGDTEGMVHFLQLIEPRGCL
jgi:WD40 repeat protein